MRDVMRTRVMITEQSLGDLVPPTGAVRSVEETVNRVTPGAAAQLQDDETAADGTGVEVSGETSADAVLDRPELTRLQQFAGGSLEIGDLEVVDGEAVRISGAATRSEAKKPPAHKRRPDRTRSSPDAARLRPKHGDMAGDVPGLRRAQQRDASAVTMRRYERPPAHHLPEMSVRSDAQAGSNDGTAVNTARPSSAPRSVADLSKPDTNVRGIAGHSQDLQRARMEEELAMMAQIRRREMRVQRGR